MTTPTVGDVYEDKRKPGRRVRVLGPGPGNPDYFRVELIAHPSLPLKIGDKWWANLSRQWVRVDTDTKEDRP